jgi:hypothetical protein
MQARQEDSDECPTLNERKLLGRKMEGKFDRSNARRQEAKKAENALSDRGKELTVMMLLKR